MNKFVIVTIDSGENMRGLKKDEVGRIKKKMLENDCEILIIFHSIINQEAM